MEDRNLLLLFVKLSGKVKNGFFLPIWIVFFFRAYEIFFNQKMFGTIHNSTVNFLQSKNMLGWVTVQSYKVNFLQSIREYVELGYYTK